MANRVLTFYDRNRIGDNTRIGAAYYIEAPYEPVVIRIEAEYPPVEGDLEIDIFDDGVSINRNHSASYEQSSSTMGATIIYDPADTTVCLSEGQTQEDYASTSLNPIEEGSWITCKAIRVNSARNISVHLELESIG